MRVCMRERERVFVCLCVREREKERERESEREKADERERRTSVIMRNEYPGVRNSLGKLRDDVDGLSNLSYTFMCSHDNPTQDTVWKLREAFSYSGMDAIRSRSS